MTFELEFPTVIETNAPVEKWTIEQISNEDLIVFLKIGDKLTKTLNAILMDESIRRGMLWEW